MTTMCIDCRPNVQTDAGIVGIVLCPLHAAAPELLASLKTVLKGAYWLTDADFDKARTAVIHAEGRE